MRGRHGIRIKHGAYHRNRSPRSGTLGLPPRFQPLDIGPDYILGLWRDADDVEHVRMYQLVKP